MSFLRECMLIGSCMSENCIGPDVIHDGVNGIVLPDIQPASIASKFQMLESDRTTLLAMKASEFACLAHTERLC